MPDAQRKTQYSSAWIMLLALLTSLGPLSIDMYLPALPQMAQDFGVSDGGSWDSGSSDFGSSGGDDWS